MERKKESQYIIGLILRVVLCFIPLAFFEFVFRPLTIYLSYFLLIPFKAVLLHDAIFVGVNNFNFISACIAPSMYYLLWFLVLLTKEVEFFKRVKIILVGFGLLLGMNVLRVVVLILIADTFGIAAFESVHLLWWEFMSGIYVALVWIFLIKWFKVESVPVWDDLKELIGIVRGK